MHLPSLFTWQICVAPSIVKGTPALGSLSGDYMGLPALGSWVLSPWDSLLWIDYSVYLFMQLVFKRRRQWQPTPVLLPGKSHGWRSLVGCSPWGREELDTTERLHFGFSLSCIGEGNGNPLQCSCLENPRDGGAWWAAVYGVAQSWTRLKWLSSSSSRWVSMVSILKQVLISKLLVWWSCYLPSQENYFFQINW